MRKVSSGKALAPVQWVPMKHEADCWIAACAMAAGTAYEEAEQSFGPGFDYSERTLSEADDVDTRRVIKGILFCQQYSFFVDHGLYALFVPSRDPDLKSGRRYLLSAKIVDPKRPWMAHAIVVDEIGKVFDPDPNYKPDDPKYSIGNYADLLGWEIVKWTF